MKIFGWAGDQAGCHHYRLRLPFGQLQTRGHQTKTWTRVPEQWLNTVAGIRPTPAALKLTPPEWVDLPDVFVGQRTARDGSTYFWQRLARHPNRPLMVYELDDNLWEIPPTNTVAHSYFKLTGNNQRLLHNMTGNIKVADVVTVTTDTLAEYVSKWNPNIAVLPNCVPQSLLDQPRALTHLGQVVVGWQGSPTHAMDWEGIAPQIRRGMDRANPDSVLHLMGSPPEQLTDANPGARISGWNGDIDSYYQLIDWDIALAPLRAHPFNTRGKSDLRVLEAAALRIPAVASHVYPYEAVVQHGATGLLCRQDHEWATHLRTLINDHELRRQMGQQAHEWAKTRTIETNIHGWEKVYGVG